MNNKVCLFLLFVFLILMLLFYYLNLESNVIVLLGVVIVLLLNDLIVNREHFFSPNENIDSMLKNVQNTLDKLKNLKPPEEKQEEQFPYLVVKSSCAPQFEASSGEIKLRDPISDSGSARDELGAIKIPHLDESGLSVDVDTAESLSGISNL